jgi:hypothetical protein
MCGTCRWFETDADAPARRGGARASKAAKGTVAGPTFRCAALVQPLDRNSLRLDCLAYEAADAVTQARNWKILKQA